MLTGTQEQEPAVVMTPMNEAAGRVLKNVTFQSAPAAVGEARRTVGSLVAAHPAAYVIELLTSELVTNAVIHGQSDLITMTVMRTFTGLKVSVADSGPGFIPGFVPMTSGEAEGVDARDAAEEYGRGLVLVATLALQWGTIQDSRGATVWFTMGDRPPDAWRI